LLILLHILDWIIYIAFFLNVMYLFVYSLASHFTKPKKPQVALSHKRIAILIAAYKEDSVIEECVDSCLKQDYSSSNYDVVVISDHMSINTNDRLRSLPIKILQVDFKESTNTKSLKAAISHLQGCDYDIVLIVDADNIVGKSYLSDINDAFANTEVQAVQTHRVAKNKNTRMAYLDAISEEINNSIFRLGHVNIGMPAALIGSGMAFRYPLFCSIMESNQSINGFDRFLELKLLYEQIFIRYLPDTYIYDEKVQNTCSFFRQRRRWLSAQCYNISNFKQYIFHSIYNRKWGFCDKIYQHITLPRILLLGLTFIFAILFSFLLPHISYKWWGLLFFLLIGLALAIPRKLWTFRFIKSLFLVPYSFILMIANLFFLKQENKKFSHTKHGY